MLPGKSSLINMLTNNKKLAKTSSTPGKTLLINHFLINKEWYLVDLPGYGYAKISKKEQEKLQQIISSYILRREQMTNLFVLVESRHEPQKIDMEFNGLEKTESRSVLFLRKPTSPSRLNSKPILTFILKP